MGLAEALDLSFENLHRTLHPLQTSLALGEERWSPSDIVEGALKGGFFSFESAFLASHKGVLFLFCSIKVGLGAFAGRAFTVNLGDEIFNMLSELLSGTMDMDI
jgi:hypothetical protein